MGSLGAAQSLRLAPLTSPELWGPALLPVWPQPCGVGIYISGSCRDREPPRLLVLILCPLQGEVGDPGAAGVRGLDGEQVQTNSWELCPHPDGAAPASPSPAPCSKDGKGPEEAADPQRSQQVKAGSMSCARAGLLLPLQGPPGAPGAEGQLGPKGEQVGAGGGAGLTPLLQGHTGT